MMDEATLLSAIKRVRAKKIAWARQTLLEGGHGACIQNVDPIECTGAPVERVFGPDVPMLDEDMDERRQLAAPAEFTWYETYDPESYGDERVWFNENTYKVGKATTFYEVAQWRYATGLKGRQLLWDKHFKGVQGAGEGQVHGWPGEYSPGQDDFVKAQDRSTGDVKYMSLDEAQRALVFTAVMQDRDLKARIREWMAKLECKDNEPPCMLMPYVNPQLPVTTAQDWDMEVVNVGGHIKVAICIKFSFICDAPYQGWRRHEGKDNGNGNGDKEGGPGDRSGGDGGDQPNGGDDEEKPSDKPESHGGIRRLPGPHPEAPEPGKYPKKPKEGTPGGGTFAEPSRNEPWSWDWRSELGGASLAESVPIALVGGAALSTVSKVWAARVVAWNNLRSISPWQL